MIIPGSDNAVYETGKRTIGDEEFVITTTSTGLYVIDTLGHGKPKICEEKFTSLAYAQKALDKYERDNAATLLKKKVMKEGIEKRKAAAE